MEPIKQNEKNNGAIRFSAILGGALIGTIIVFFSVKMIFPAQFAEIKQRYEMWKAGAHSIVPAAKVRGLELDRCEKSPDCACVLLVHGMGDSLSTWRRLFLADASVWKSKLRLFAIDLPGFGGSGRPKDSNDYRVKNLAKDLSLFLQERQTCKKTLVVGNSFGGWVATWLAIEHPEQVQALLLLGSTGLKDAESNRNVLLLGEPTVESLKEFQKKAYFKPREYDDSFWKMAVERAKKSNSKEVRAAQKDQDYLDSVLQNLKVKTIYVHGRADQIVPEADARALVSRIPGAEMQVIENCGHLPQKECPAEIISRIDALAAGL